MAKKKSFDTDLANAINPAMQFISTPVPEHEKAKPPTRSAKKEVPSGYYANPLYTEKKSRRVQLLIKPSLYEKLKRRAAAQTDGSINAAINTILEETLKGE